MLTLTKENFEQEVLQSDRPVFIFKSGISVQNFLFNNNRYLLKLS